MLMRNSDSAFMTAEKAACRNGYASRSELALRRALEDFARQRWPAARLCHEMVMGERQVRADMVAIDAAHIAAFEVKGEYDSTIRLLHQVGMYQLCVPEVWMVVTDRHSGDAELIRHLLPSVGLLVAPALFHRSGYATPDVDSVDLEIAAEAKPRAPHVDAMLGMMWRAELAGMCSATRCFLPGPKTTMAPMLKTLRALPVAELQREVCRELRARHALWRADAPIAEPVS
jgi:hypothetical protein